MAQITHVWKSGISCGIWVGVSVIMALSSLLFIKDTRVLAESQIEMFSSLKIPKVLVKASKDLWLYLFCFLIGDNTHRSSEMLKGCVNGFSDATH